jgi:GNAT superfamily N-acetyltransferase
MRISEAGLEQIQRRWHAAWTLSRGWTDHHVEDGIVITRVGQRGKMPTDPGRMVEYFPLDPDTYPDRLKEAAARAIADEHPPGASWVTIVTRDPGKLTTELTITDEEWLMATDLTAHPAAPAPASYVVDTTVHGNVIDVRVLHGDEEAARGRMAVSGEDAVADMISTDEAHRRRGLGSTVMGALAQQAVKLGAAKGLLIASREGRQLYTRLGWHTLAEVRIGKTA